MVAFVDDQMAIVNDKVISLAPAHEGLDQCYVDDAGQSSFAAADNPYRGAVIFVVIGRGCAMWRLVEFRLGPGFGAFFFGHLYALAAFSTRSIAATPDDVPPRPLREMRELLRYRRKLTESRAAGRNRLLKLLETANIKLASVMSDVFGLSGRAMLRALIEGRASVEAMADLARGQLRRKRSDLTLALEGRMEEHDRFLLATQLRRLEAIEQDIATLDLRITERLEPYRMPHALLMQIPGVDWLVAAVLIAEIGIDMSVFLSVYHLSASAGVCPGSHESAGRQKSGRARKGNVHLRTILVGAAISAARTKGSYLKDKFHRLKARRGAMRAALAIAHKILVSAYHMLAKGLPYRDLGEAYLDQISQTRTVANLKRRLERLGYHVTLERTTQAA
jgi:transposase